ncbi:MAG TPA: hypothetical protein VMG40_04480, partial [Bryobacteraceae bacterium]|nr:hypothetical protein [Bryobacteraceae bacterium]
GERYRWGRSVDIRLTPAVFMYADFLIVDGKTVAIQIDGHRGNGGPRQMISAIIIEDRDQKIVRHFRDEFRRIWAHAFAFNETDLRVAIEYLHGKYDNVSPNAGSGLAPKKPIKAARHDPDPSVMGK